MRAKKSLLERAAALEHFITAEDDLHIIADGDRFEPVRLSETRVAILLPANCREIELRSRTFIPTQIHPESQDDRRLGICVGRLQIDGQDLALDQAEAFARGWHDVEHYPNNFRQRWTDGVTPLPANARLIVIDIAGRSYYWRDRKDNVVDLFGRRGIVYQ
jgi:hypothetical protein